MARDTTLDAFASATDREPLQITLSWTPDGAACAACGRTVEQRWHDGDGFVCTDCKRWNRS